MSAPECTDVFPNPRPLGVLRGEIDKIDSQLVELLNARARLAQEVGARKRMFPTDSDTIYSPSREQMLLSRIHNSNKGPLRRNTIESIWREIMSGSISLEKGLTIGYLGPEYSFTHLAATKHFGNSLNYSPVKTIKSLFEECNIAAFTLLQVERGAVDYGVVPIENSSIGTVKETAASLLTYQPHVSIITEVQVHIQHALIAVPGTTLADLECVYSKAEALEQCSNRLRMMCPQARLMPASSTSAAVEMVASAMAGSDCNAKKIGAIGSTKAAEALGLQVLEEVMNDNLVNVTRFLILSNRTTAKKSLVRTGDDKTTFALVLSHEVPSIAAALEGFSRNRINVVSCDKLPIQSHMLWTECARDEAVTESALAKRPMEESTSNQVIGTTMHSQAGLSTGDYHSRDISHNADDDTRTPFGNAYMVEVQGHLSDENMSRAISRLTGVCKSVALLGSYPRARIIL